MLLPLRLQYIPATGEVCSAYFGAVNHIMLHIQSNHNLICSQPVRILISLYIIKHTVIPPSSQILPFVPLVVEGRVAPPGNSFVGG